MALHLPQNTTAAIFLKPLGSTAWTTSKTARVTRGRSANKGRKRKWILGAQNRNSTCTPVVFFGMLFLLSSHHFLQNSIKIFCLCVGGHAKILFMGPNIPSGAPDCSKHMSVQCWSGAWQSVRIKWCGYVSVWKIEGTAEKETFLSYFHSCRKLLLFGSKVTG